MAKNNTKKEKYYYALGRRKTAVATIRLYEGKGEDTINEKPIKSIYTSKTEISDLYKPFRVTDTKGEFHFTAKTSGGGKQGQLGAMILGIARALVEYAPEFKSKLKEKDLLTRDPRMVERKKAGLRKARKAPQYSKR
ncbi:30S ribosomal protein S9 [Candidatus Dojkabacteria bacterium]|nr:30S ribosomal protein S9 [Candidatus Dojkabacteria bacterium]